MSVKSVFPRYACHKEVSAVKIKDIVSSDKPGEMLIVPDDAVFAPIPVDLAYLSKHSPTVGGYFVVYDDGYQSFSPAGPFEAGYTLIGG